MILFQNLLHFYSADFSAVSASYHSALFFFEAGGIVGFVILELPCFFLSNLLSTYPIDSYTPPNSHKLRLFISRPLYHASSSKALHHDGLLSPQAQASGDAEQALAERSVDAAAMVTVEARAMVAMMAAANATAIAVCLRYAKSDELWSMEAWCGCSGSVCVFDLRFRMSYC